MRQMPIVIRQDLTSKEKRTKWVQLLVTIIGVAIAIASLLFGLSLRKKELTVIFRGSDSLVEVGGILGEDVAITYRGEHIRSLSKVNLLLRNTGALAIKAEDVKEPLV